MKYLTTILTFIIITITLNDVNSQDPSTLDGSKFLKNFYTEYVTELNKLPGADIRRKIEEIKKEYCTKSLLLELQSEEIDSDPFLKAQDVDNNCLKTLSIKKDSIYKDQFIVSYLDTYTNKDRIIRIVLVEEDGKLKINNIL